MEVFSAGAGPPSVGRGGRRGAGGLHQLPFPFKTGWFPSFLGGSEAGILRTDGKRGRRIGVGVEGGGGC